MSGRKCLGSLFVALCTGLLVAACDVANSPVFGEEPSIEYVVSGGFAGGIHRQLTVSTTGLATLNSTYPPLELQLSSADHATLLQHFGGFRDLPDNFPSQCIDALIFSIALKGTDFTKRVVIDECTLYDKKDSLPQVSAIAAQIAALESLADTIYRSRAPWRGLTTDFSIDKDVYGIGEPITLRYVISNPTSSEKAIYFRHQSQIWFGVDSYSIPGFHYECPPAVSNDPTPPSEITIGAGEQKEITYVWNQHIQTANGDSALGIGYFCIHMNLFAGELPTKDIWFEVLDRTIPIGGVVTPDWNGESSDSPSYTFALSVRNWTSSPVSLHFPSSQTISVELYDLDLPTPGPLLYAGPSDRDSFASVVTLAPGESKTFTHTANKSDIVPWYMWTYVRIRLLCSDFTFVRDGELRLFQYRPSGSREGSRLNKRRLPIDEKRLNAVSPFKTHSED